MNLLKNKSVIITGGSRGIGKAIAEKFAQNGANLAITCIKMSNEALDLVKNLESLGVKAKAYESDASCLLYTSPSPRDGLLSRMPSSA